MERGPLSTPAAIAVVLVLCGVGLRMPGLSDPPLDFHPTRQYHSAIIARGYSLDLLSDWEPAARLAAATAAQNQARIEPRVMEHFASWVYHVVGREDLALARMLAVLAWSLGGLAVYWLAIDFVAAPAAIASVAVWTFAPFAIRASRAFQPDPLMTALIVLSIGAAVSFGRRPTPARGALFCVALAAALAVKAVSVFFLAPSLIVLVLFGNSSVRTKVITSGLAILATAPAAWYYATLHLATNYGPFLQLLGTRQFWYDWATMIDHVVPWPLLIAAVAGAVLSKGDLRRLVVALLIGYIAFGIVFTHHIHTHDYYSLPLVPVVTLGIGALVDQIVRRWRERTGAMVAAVICTGCVVWGGLEVVSAQGAEQVTALAATAERYERIGRVVGHSTRVLSLDETYGFALTYHGRIVTFNWPLSADLALMSLTGERAEPAEDRLRAAGAEFFVGTSQLQLNAQPDLAETLKRQNPVLERDATPERWFVVYDLRRTILSTTPEHLSIFSRVGEPAPPAESVSLFAAPTTRWAVRVPENSPIRVLPTEGTGPATLSVSTTNATREMDRSETVSVNAVTNESTTFEVRIRVVAGPNMAPFGFVDAPPDPISLGEVPVVIQGWALDDTAMQRVFAGYVGGDGQMVVLGDARRGGLRPDVAAAHPTAHDLFKAAWAFTLDPAAVRGVSRPFDLLFFGEDGIGQRAQIGKRSVH